MQFGRRRRRFWKEYAGIRAGTTDLLTPAFTHTLKPARANPKVAEILTLLPQRNCGRCGYESCYDLAVAIAEGKERPDACRIAGKRIAGDIEKILRR